MKIKPALLILPFILFTSCDLDESTGLSKYQNINAVSDFAPELWIKNNTFKGSFSDDYKTFYFFRKIASGVEKYVPYQSNYRNDKWEEAKISGYYNEENSYTYQLKVPVTNKLYFLSDKRTSIDTSATPNYNFWKVELSDNRYSEPKELGYQSLIYNYNSQPCITKDGTIYFTSDLPDWSKTLSYKMEVIDQQYVEPILFDPVNEWRENKAWKIFEFCVSPNEDYLIICIQDKIDSTLSTDLYISYYRDNVWTHPKKLNNDINSSDTENFPMITNDGKYLVFTRAFSEFKIISTDKIK